MFAQISEKLFTVVRLYSCKISIIWITHITFQTPHLSRVDSRNNIRTAVNFSCENIRAANPAFDRQSTDCLLAAHVFARVCMHAL